MTVTAKTTRTHGPLKEHGLPGDQIAFERIDGRPAFPPGVRTHSPL